MAVVLLTIGLFGLAMLAMAVGFLVKGTCLRGSCGGPEVLGPDGQPITCASCPNRKARRADRPTPVTR